MGAVTVEDMKSHNLFEMPNKTALSRIMWLKTKNIFFLILLILYPFSIVQALYNFLIFN